MLSIKDQIYNYFCNFQTFVVDEWKKLPQIEKIKKLSLVIFSLFIGLTCIYKLHKFLYKKNNVKELEIHKVALNIIDPSKLNPIEPLPLPPSQEGEKEKPIHTVEKSLKVVTIPKIDPAGATIVSEIKILNNLIDALTSLGSPQNLEDARKLKELKLNPDHSDITAGNIVNILLASKPGEVQYENNPSLHLLTNKEFILFALKEDASNGLDCFEYSNPQLRNDKQFVLEAMNLSHRIFELVGESLKNDLDVVSAYLHKCFTDDIEESILILNNSKSFFLSVMSKTKLPKNFLVRKGAFVSDLLRKDSEFTLEVLKNNPHIKIDNISLLNNKKWVLQAFINMGKNASYLFKKISKNLQLDPEVLFACLEQDSNPHNYDARGILKDDVSILQIVTMNSLFLKFVHKDWKVNADIVLNALKQDGRALRYLSKDLRANKAFAFAAILSHLLALNYVSEELKEELKEKFKLEYPAIEANTISIDKGCAINYIKEDYHNYEWLTDELKNDFDIALAYIQQDHRGLFKISSALLRSKKFVKRLSEIIPSNEKLELNDHHLKDTRILLNLMENYPSVDIAFVVDQRDFVEKAININPRIYAEQWEDFPDDPKVALAALQLDPSLIPHLNPDFWNDKGFLLKAIKVRRFCYYYANSELRKDPDLISAFQAV